MESEIYITLPSNSSKKFFANNSLSKYTTKLDQKLTLQDGQRYKVGLAELIIPADVLPAGIKDCYIYCSLCAMSYVGDTYSRLLRVIRVNDKMKKFSYDFNKIHYYALQEREIDTIDIWITDQKGATFSFKTTDHPVIVVLCIARE